MRLSLFFYLYLFHGNFINSFLMSSSLKWGVEELCQNHISLFSTDETSRHHKYICIVVLAGQVCYCSRPAKCGTDALMFV